jgi:hypothetical protein
MSEYFFIRDGMEIARVITENYGGRWYTFHNVYRGDGLTEGSVLAQLKYELEADSVEGVSSKVLKEMDEEDKWIEDNLKIKGDLK